MNVPAYKRMTFEEYLELDQESEHTRFEFVDGVAYAMTGGSVDHSGLIANLTVQLASQLRGKKTCRPFDSNLRIRVPSGDCYYADFSIVCGKIELDPADKKAPKTILNPTFIAEVLSPSTRAVDLGPKLNAYATIPSLVEYLVVDPENRVVRQHVRLKTSAWFIRPSMEQGITEVLIGLMLNVDELWASLLTEDDVARFSDTKG